jgi:hypothetical protein
MTAVVIPDRFTSRWIATLENEQLTDVESRLHADFRTQDAAEKARRGARYRLFEGPAALVDAWNRWHLVNNETRKRGIAIRDLR